MNAKTHLTIMAVSPLGEALLLSLGGCSTPNAHTYVLGKHVMSKAEREGRAPLPNGRCPPTSDGTIVTFNF